MKFPVEQRISNFVSSQFPAFYQEEGPNFILFMKAYYEWMEESGNPIKEARSLFDYRDIDNTLEGFLEHFQKKYLYGIPFNVIINKRFLLKHILDVYRSKGSIQCYRLLFKLLYNQDVEVYLPGRDLLKPSDGTWVQPRYIEVTNVDDLNDYVGKKVVGVSSRTTAVVESYIIEPINKNIVATLFISNILPRGGEFSVGEKICLEGQESSINVQTAPTVTGSLDRLEIINGGQGFNVGDILKIAHRSISNNDVISYGIDGQVRVTSVSRGEGAVTFQLIDGGFGFTANASTFVYNGPADTTGEGADFDVGAISFTQDLTYNTDLLCDYASLNLDNANYGFPGNATSNATMTFNQFFSYQNNSFGSIAALVNIETGDNYTQEAVPFVRSTLSSKALSGSVTYTNAANTVTGSGTTFTSYFANGDVIGLRANSSLSGTEEYFVIKTVANNTSLTLYGRPTYNSTASAQFKVAPTVFRANYAPYETIMHDGDGTNEDIASNPSVGENIVATTTAIDSGKAYVQGEFVTAYLANALDDLTIAAGGVGYANGDTLVFAGGGTPSVATGFVTTNSNGTITAAPLTYAGSGYDTIPEIRVKSVNGTGARLTTTIVDINTFSEVTGTVAKTGIGRKVGYWSTTRGFLNSDKYIQDSYFYQDYSYQIKVASTLNKYRDILYSTFHPSGSEMFGQFQLITTEAANAAILHEQTTATIS